MNLASRVALLHLLEEHEAGRPLPDLDQPYFETMLAVMDPVTRHQRGKSAAGEARRVALRTFVDQVPAYHTLAPFLSYSGAKFLANRVAQQLATSTKNGVVFRLWGLQRKALRYWIKRRVHFAKLQGVDVAINGKEMEKLLNDLQLFLRNPARHRADGLYGQQREPEENFPDIKPATVIQVPKSFSYSRKAIKLEPASWKQVLRSCNIQPNGEQPTSRQQRHFLGSFSPTTFSFLVPISNLFSRFQGAPLAQSGNEIA